MSADVLRVALVGNPNCGKSALFNLLTGSRQKVANYPGVTVEKREGEFTDAKQRRCAVLDLPGTYSLQVASADERVTRDVVIGGFGGQLPPDLLVAVLDATNLRLGLRLVLELKAIGRPMIVALNLIDLARQRGLEIDIAKLQLGLGVPVVETVAVRKHGAQALIGAIAAFTPDASAQADSERRVDAAKIATLRRIAVPEADAQSIQALYTQVEGLLDASVHKTVCCRLGKTA